MTKDSIVFVDERPIADFLDQALAVGRDMSVPFRAIAGVMAYAVEKNFEQEGRPDKWLELATKTKAARLSDAAIKRQIKEGKIGFGTMKILQDTGRLSASITTQSNASSATMGTNTLYAAIHQFGGPAGRGLQTEIPARPFLQLDEDDMEEIVDILNRHLASV